MAGYHKKEIVRGQYGQLSKITEEYEELMDAADQRNPVMILQELSDLVGAVEAFVKRYNITLEDLITMKDATKKAFDDGTRSTISRGGQMSG